MSDSISVVMFSKKIKYCFQFSNLKMNDIDNLTKKNVRKHKLDQ